MSSRAGQKCVLVVMFCASAALQASVVSIATPAGTGDRLMETVLVSAGENATVPCPGLSDGDALGDYIVNRLAWTCSARRACAAAASTGELADYRGRQVVIQGDGDRLDLDRRTWSLLISPAEAGDSGTYSCSFNGQTGGQRVVKLVVLDVPSRPGRPMVIKHQSRQVNLSWAPSFRTNNSPIQHYVIQTRYGESGAWPPVEAGQRTVNNQTNVTVSGLSPFTVYTFRVVAVNAQGYSQPSDASYPVITLRERPGAAPNLTYVRSRSSTSLEVGWVPPANRTLNGEFTGYRLTYRRAEPAQRPGLSTTVQLHDVSDRSYLIEGLKPFTRYEITLQVKNPEDMGPPDSITGVTGEGAPSRPEAVSFSGVGDRSLSIAWKPPRRRNGILRGYTVYWTSNDGPVRKSAISANRSRTYTLNRLEPDQEYSVWLKARTGAGEGDRSFPIRARTDVSGPGPPVITNITCPTDTSLGLQWRRPDVFYRSVDMYYLLYRYDEAWDFVERMVPVRSERPQFSINLPNLTSNKIYDIRVQGATISRLDRNKVYKGQQSASRKVRIERGCEEIQLYSTWKHRPRKTLAGAEVTGIFLGCFLVLTIVIIAVIWRRRQKQCPQPAKPGVKPSSAAAARPAGWPAPSHEAVPSHLFAQHVRQQHADGGDGFRREWAMLQRAAPLADGRRTSVPTPAESADPETPTYRQTRVTIGSRLYRNKSVPAAHYVDGYQRARAFIVADRPSLTSYDALWRLAWEQNVTAVVIVGKLEGMAEWLLPELGRVRPFGDLQVRGLAEHPLAGCVVRDFTVSKLKGRTSKRPRERRVQMFHYTDWPASGLPESPLSLLMFVRRTLRAEGAARTPTLVVCGTQHGSAGIYVGLSTLITQLKCNQELGVLSYWQHVIGQCPYLLRTVEEYAFLHDCLLERVTVGDTLVSRDEVRLYIEQLQGGYRNSFPYPAAEKQFKNVIALDTKHFTVVSAARPCNEAKNRSLSYIPMEPSRVLLNPTPGLEGTDYINASWLPGYRSMREYILTQHPVASTVLDFWQMVWDHRVTTVACLSPEGCVVFWPLEEEVIHGPGFVVRYMSESTDCSATYKTSWIIRSFLVESTTGIDDVTVRVVHLPLWPEECSIDSVMEGVKGVREIQGDRLTPLVVIDKYGGTEGATFCLLGAVLRHLQREACFDIFTYAKLYHQRRPGIWKNMREFLYLYHAVEAWLEARGDGALFRAGSCTSLCENRTPTDAGRHAALGVIV